MKVVDPLAKHEINDDVAETLCCMEKDLPPAFFDIMVHLMIHLMEELFVCGLIQTRWMYPFERYYKGMKSTVRNLAKLEGSVAKEYELEEALGYVTEYMASYEPTSRKVWDDKEDPTMVDEKPQELSDELLGWMHGFVCDNAVILEPYRR
jgi:hypothetical protein